MYDSAFITQFPTLYKNTQERHVSGHEIWEIGSVLEEKKKVQERKGGWEWKELVRRADDVSNPTTSFPENAV